jgi:hypothetical protein
MISELLVLLKDAVNDHLSASSGWGSTQPDHGQVVFLDSDKLDGLELKLGAVTLMLVNLEQEHSMRAADPYRLAQPDGTLLRVLPPIHLNVYVLFLARFKEYQQSLRYISFILQYFQNHRVLDHESAPALSERIEKVVMELVTLPLSDQHNLWSLLRCSYQPSLLYKVRMVVFQDEDGVAAPEGAAPTVRINP